MGFSLSRLTFYGILSAFDSDLRSIVKSLPNSADDLTVFLGSELYEKLKGRQLSDSDNNNNQNDLIDFLDLGDSIQIINRNRKIIPPNIQALFERNANAIRDIVPIRNRVMHARPLEYSDGTKIEKVCDVLKSVKHFPETNAFLEKLDKDPYFPFSLAAEDIGASDPSSRHNLPIPDFDETGFLGRHQETTQLIAACKGPWPVITVVGEGGYGKTAIALQAAYRILDDEENPFDYIVWTSSKTTRLSLREIETIEDAITTSMGVIQDVTETLAGKITTPEDAINEVAEYLNNFKILLILDNLETVLDKNIISLFSKLNGKSKILATSRLGTGEMNFRFPIGPLSDDDSVRLLRSTAKVRNVGQLAKAKPDDLTRYCRRMKGNPGFIKWFVSSVQCGKRPEEVLVEPKIFLDFCLSNVYSYMSEDARMVASVMLAVPGQHSQSILAYISDISGDRFQEALQQLWSANLVTMLSVGTATGQQTVYELGELPRLYIIKNHPSSQQTVKNFQARKRSIEQFYRSNFLGTKKDEFNLHTIKLRTKDDSVVAKYLRDALHLAPSHYEQAMELIEKSKSLDPGYHEVHRVEAIIQRAHGNFPAAVECYEMAIECEPSSAPLRYWYAGFLMRDADDIEGALRQFEAAQRLDDDSPPISLEHARCLMFDGRLQEADKVLAPITKRSDLVPLMLRKTSDLSLQIALRRAESDIPEEEKLTALNELFRRFSEMPKANIDHKCNETISKAASIGEKLLNAVITAKSENSAEALRENLENLYGYLEKENTHIESTSPKKNNPPLPEDADSWKIGHIKNYNDLRKFGFIVYDDNKNIFFHQRNISANPGVVTPGDKVSFYIEHSNGKFSAKTVRFEGSEAVVGEEGNGFIKSIVRDKGFGFLFAQGGKELFFHKSACVASFESLEPGDKVSFREGKNHQGECAESVALVE